MEKEGVIIELDSQEASVRLVKLLKPHFTVSQVLGDGVLVQELDQSQQTQSKYDRLCTLIHKLNSISPETIVSSPVFKNLPLLVALRKSKQLRLLVPLHTDRDAMNSASRFIRTYFSDTQTQIDRLANYAGLQASLYFQFIRSYRNWLLLPAVLAIVLAVKPSFDFVTLAPCTLVWASAFLSFGWQPLRRLAKERPRGLSMQVLGYHEDESNWSRKIRIVWSGICFSCFTLGSVSLLFLTLNSQTLSSFAVVRTVVFAVVSQGLGALVDPIARKLTSWEHHGDDFAYEGSRITKAVILRLAFFFPFPIHLAFSADHALPVIQQHLAATFTTKQIISSAMEMLPWISARVFTKRLPTQSWKGQVWTTNDEYLEMGIQFATLMAFGFLWPLSFALAFVNNVFEGICDAEKLALCRRPFPSNTDLNKLWLRTFRILTLVGASVNVALLLKLGERDREFLFAHYMALIAVAILAARGYRDLAKLFRDRKSKSD